MVALVLGELDVGKALPAPTERGGSKAPEKPVAQNLPPVVHITDPADLATVDGGDVIVSFETEAADPVRNVMALVNGRLALRQPRQETAGGWVTGRGAVPPAGEDTLSLIAENAEGKATW